MPAKLQIVMIKTLRQLSATARAGDFLLGLSDVALRQMCPLSPPTSLTAWIPPW